MKKVLHIIRDRSCQFALQMALNQENQGNAEVTVLLLQDGVYCTDENGLSTYACREDAEARGIRTPFQQVDYEGILDLICQSDSVVTW